MHRRGHDRHCASLRSQAGGSVRYPHLTNLPRGGKATLALRYQSGRGGAVEVRANSTSGGSAQLLLGTCVLRPTAAGFEEAGCQLSIPAAAWAHEIELELTAKVSPWLTAATPYG